MARTTSCGATSRPVNPHLAHGWPTVTSSAEHLHVDAHWQVVAAVGDYNGDGKADLVWTQPGRRAARRLWLMNGTSPASTSVILADSNWVMAPANGP